MPKTVLTPKELCARWEGNISDKTLANWRSHKPEPKGPRFRRVGNRILYPIEAVIAYEQAREVETFNEPATRRSRTTSGEAPRELPASKAASPQPTKRSRMTPKPKAGEPRLSRRKQRREGKGKGSR